MHKIYFRHLPLNYVILLGETVKAVLTLGIVFISPYSSALIPAYLVLQGIFSPVQGGKSDSFSRKNAILVALIATAAAQFLIFCAFLATNGGIISTSLLSIGLLVQGRWGNIPSVSRASLSDEKNHMILSFTLPISFAILSIPWIAVLKILPANVETLVGSAYVKFIPLFLLALSGWIYLYVRSQLEKQESTDSYSSAHYKMEPWVLDIKHSNGMERLWLHLKYEPKFVFSELKKTIEILGRRLFGWIGGILFEYGFHSIFYYLDESKTFVKEGLTTQLSLFVCFVAGSLFKPILIASNMIGILFGISLSLLSIFLHNLFPNAVSLWQGCLGFGSGVFLTCFYLHFLANQKIHNRGKIVGAGDSMQSAGEILGASTYSVIALGFARSAPQILVSEVKLLPIILFILSIFCFIYSFRKEDHIE